MERGKIVWRLLDAKSLNKTQPTFYHSSNSPIEGTLEEVRAIGKARYSAFAIPIALYMPTVEELDKC